MARFNDLVYGKLREPGVSRRVLTTTLRQLAILNVKTGAELAQRRLKQLYCDGASTDALVEYKLLMAWWTGKRQLDVQVCSRPSN